MFRSTAATTVILQSHDDQVPTNHARVVYGLNVQPSAGGGDSYGGGGGGGGGLIAQFHAAEGSA